ncbi:MAG: PAS domain S-box/diguanylate cyclase (GGDEF) domain-containing [Planctomycetota bacterium]|nr:MAG: PAS domain S-box/diguanylate cyclase (GGDEF) domain-containing [Planctomycetota bacterium]
MLRSEAYLRAILEHSADAIVTTDEAGNVAEWNPAAEHLFGWKREEILGKPAEGIWEEPEERRKLLRLIEKKGRVIDYETRVKSRDGRSIDVSVTMSQLRDESGKLLGTIGISKDIRRRKRLERELKRLAITDSLTGLYNRAHFNERVVEEVERAKRMKHPLSMALADLDGFKEYNDSQGHQAGDGALRKVGRAALTTLRRHVDLAFRYGGDEFVFIFPEVELEAGRTAAERLRARVEQEVGPAITSSIGVATMKDGMSSRELVRAADLAMYRAKAAGGNRVHS